MIAKGLITQRANDEQLPAQTIERDYVLAHVCAAIGAINEPRLVFKGGTLLRLCYFLDYRYSADLDFSAVGGLTAEGAIRVVGNAIDTCRRRIEMPTLEVSDPDVSTAWIMYVGPLGSRPRRIKLDISDTELVETQHRAVIRQRWPDLTAGAAVESYTFDEVGAEKLRCIAERVQCRDLYDLHALLDGQHIDVMEAWHLYLRKAANDVARGRQRTPPREWATAFERRLTSYRGLWDRELGDYLSEFPALGMSNDAADDTSAPSSRPPSRWRSSSSYRTCGVRGSRGASGPEGSPDRQAPAAERTRELEAEIADLEGG